MQPLVIGIIIIIIIIIIVIVAVVTSTKSDPDPAPAPVKKSSAAPVSVQSDNKCSSYTNTSTNISDECMSQLWKNSGCTTDIGFSSRGSAYWKTLPLSGVKTDMLAWSTNSDDVAKQGCYNISPPPAASAPAPAPYTNKSLKAEAGGRCVDVPGASKDNIFLQMYDCNGTPAQTWSYDGVKHIVNAGSGRCLDANMRTGRVQQYSCEGPSNKTQRWNLIGNQIQLEEDPSKCLNINGGAGNQGDGLIIYPCSENGPNEHFSFV